ncbi:Hsp70 family protein [Vibrio rotiferianus]|uniref:Hsp70 family protein n=1 Tax=Vibrio rotiferianus TaxID=190895 RepID=UPI0033981D3C
MTDLTCRGYPVQVRVEIESLADGVDLSEPLTRARFEELNSDLFKKTLGPVKKAMEDADLKKVCMPVPESSNWTL